MLRLSSGLRLLAVVSGLMAATLVTGVAQPTSLTNIRLARAGSRPPASPALKRIAAAPAATSIRLPPPMIPVITARSGILIDADTGRVFWARDALTPRPIASLTKIFTAMEAVNLMGSLDTQMTVPQSIHQLPWDSTLMGLSPGETLSVRDLLYGMFLPSGNDAAVTLAQAGGSQARFIGGMNALARQLGLGETHFTNPWGADDRAHHSSALDLARAAMYLDAHYPQVARIADTASMLIPASKTHRAYHLRSLNKLLWTYAGATGLKTGWTGEAGGCLIATATEDGHHLLSVLLGSSNTFAETRGLLNYAVSLEQINLRSWAG
jgi:D-alanyl-D-alanine carboxypeptidase (penicillin-binding protein 5/6)